MATSYDYAPLFRSTVGFDRIFNLLENAQRARSISDWPPYDIVKTGDDSYRFFGRGRRVCRGRARHHLSVQPSHRYRQEAGRFRR